MKIAFLGWALLSAAVGGAYWQAYPLMQWSELEKKIKAEAPGETYQGTPVPFAVEGTLTGATRPTTKALHRFLERYNTFHQGKFQVPVAELMKIYVEEGQFEETGTRKLIWIALQKAMVAKSRLEQNEKKLIRLYAGAYGTLDGVPMVLGVDFQLVNNSPLRKRK